MAVLPESMDRLNYDDVKGSLATIENYIRYICERIEFRLSHVSKNVISADMSSAEVYLMLTEMSKSLSSMQSMVNLMGGKLTEISNTQSELSEQIASIQIGMDALAQRIAALESEDAT